MPEKTRINTMHTGNFNDAITVIRAAINLTDAQRVDLRNITCNYTRTYTEKTAHRNKSFTGTLFSGPECNKWMLLA